MDDITFESFSITKVFIQLPEEKPIKYEGIAIPNKNDNFIFNDISYYVCTRIFDPKSKSVTIILGVDG